MGPAVKPSPAQPYGLGPSARTGRAGTKTKGRAHAAEISKALLLRHYTSTKQLYEKILQSGCEGDPALECLTALDPATPTLVGMIHFLVRYIVLGGAIDRT